MLRAISARGRPKQTRSAVDDGVWKQCTVDGARLLPQWLYAIAMRYSIQRRDVRKALGRRSRMERWIRLLVSTDGSCAMLVMELAQARLQLLCTARLLIVVLVV